MQQNENKPNLKSFVTPAGGSNPKSIRYAWYVVFLLTLANLSSFIDRQILSLLVGHIKRDLHLSDTQMSLLMGLSFALFYTLFGIFIGHFADRFNRRNIVMAGVTLWSLMTTLCGGAKNYTQFFLARMGVGVGEATLSPSAYSMITDLFPKDRLSSAISVYFLGTFMGSGLAILIGSGLVAGLPTTGMINLPILGAAFPWQVIFLYIGIPGLIIVALMYFTIKEPVRLDKLKKEDGGEPNLIDSLGIIWKQRKVYFNICLGTAFLALIFYGNSAWIPTYFARTFGWSMPKIGLSYGIIVTLFSAFGVLTGGWLSDRLTKQGYVDGKLRVGIIAAVGILLSAFIPLIPDPNIVLFALAIPSFFMSFHAGASSAAIQEIMPNQVRALASSIFLFFINIIGLGAGPTAVALFTDYVFRDEHAIKYSLVGLFLIGGAVSLFCYWTGLKSYRQAVSEK